MKVVIKAWCYIVVLCITLGLLTSCTSTQITRGTFAPEPDNYSPAVIQVYGARTWGAKKALAIHTWISVKKAGADTYTSYEIIGWRLRRSDSALSVRHNLPDRDWMGNQPELFLDYRKPDAQVLIERIEQHIADYPYKAEYTAYPGPNSNTFTASIARAVPELGLDLPSTAIGKDYRPWQEFIGQSTTGGWQVSFLGLLGMSVGLEEGLELNLLGLNFEFDIFDLAIELPGVGRIGKSESFLSSDNSTPVNIVKKSAVIEDKTKHTAIIENP